MQHLAPAAPRIVLCTLNAKFIHASLGLRYLLANMGSLRSSTVLCEFTVADETHKLAEKLLTLLGQRQPGQAQILGLGVYVWNVRQSTELLRQLKAARPSLTVVLGGPEVSYEFERQEIVELADHVITGWGDVSFPRLCHALLHGSRPLEKIIPGEQPPLRDIALPYALYTDADLAHRLLYVEASRGCPFSCEFCLSSLDQTAWAFDLERFLAAMQELHQRGARHFKFVDRTFNLKIDTAVRILQFFLDRLSEDLFLHFELVPDHLPERLKAMIMRFPAGVLQFEVGVQSFNLEVQQRISRRQDNGKTEANVRWLALESRAHVHADLIFGLPGETLGSFAQGFDRLHALGPQEIQLGLLKRLRGAPVARHSAAHGMVYNEDPPYTVQQTGVLDAATVQRLTRFAAYWDKLANSGRFRQSLTLLLGSGATSVFFVFLAFADWLWQRTGRTRALSPELLTDALFEYLCAGRDFPVASVKQALLADYLASGAQGSPRSLKGMLPKHGTRANPVTHGLARRQRRHLLSNPVLR